MPENLNFAELKAAGKLPSPKGVALRVMHLCQEETVSLPELAHAIQADPALAGRVIKIANYVNPNKSRPIASVTTDTLILVGVHAVRQAVMAMSLINSYRDGPCKLFDYEQFWSRSVAMGSAAHAIAAAIRVAPPAEMFNCGLMHGIGDLALVTARPEVYCEQLRRHRDDPAEMLHAAQKAEFGINARDMLMLMLQDWGMPKLFLDALYYHREPESSGFPENSRLLRLTLTLQLAGLLADFCMQETVDPALSARIYACGAALDVGPEQTETFVEQTTANWEDWARMLDIVVPRFANHKLVRSENLPVARAEPVAEPVLPAPSPLRILVATADDGQRGLLGKYLKAAGHAVTTTESGLTALGQTAQVFPQVVIADWLMPGMDGITLCKNLRSTAGAHQPLYFILLTPFEDERRRLEAYEAGADEVLRTPVNTRLLLARLIAAQRMFGSGN